MIERRSFANNGQSGIAACDQWQWYAYRAVHSTA